MPDCCERWVTWRLFPKRGWVKDCLFCGAVYDGPVQEMPPSVPGTPRTVDVGIVRGVAE